MAMYSEVSHMLRTSLKELLIASENCIDYQKEPLEWDNSEKGCLGFPATILLFSIADTIGSALAEVDSFKIQFKDEAIPIISDSEHLYILRSQFYNLRLERFTIDKLYECYRSLLVHNASIPKGCHLDIGIKGEQVIVTTEVDDLSYPVKVNLEPFLDISKKAVELFIDYFDNNKEVINQSKLMTNIQEREILLTGKSNVNITSTTTGTTESRVATKDDFIKKDYE